MVTRSLFLAFLLTFFQSAQAQLGTTFNILHYQSLRLDWKSGDASEDFKFGNGLGVGVYYNFKEKMKYGAPLVKGVALELQTLNRTSDYGGQIVHSSWVRFPVYYTTEMPIRLAPGQKPIAAICSTVGLSASVPYFIDEIPGEALPSKYTNLGYYTGLGFQVIGPFDTRFKLMYNLSADMVSIGSKDAISWSKLKFMEQGFAIGMQRSFAGEKEQKVVRKAEKKAKKKSRK